MKFHNGDLYVFKPTIVFKPTLVIWFQHLIHFGTIERSSDTVSLIQDLVKSIIKVTVSFIEPNFSKRNSERFVYSYTDGSSAVQYHNSHSAFKA